MFDSLCEIVSSNELCRKRYGNMLLEIMSCKKINIIEFGNFDIKISVTFYDHSQ